MLPDQIDGENYSTFLPGNSILYPYINFTAATGSGFWIPGSNPFGNTSAPIFIQKELRIPTGADIHINDLFFKFGPETKIIVERGAKLTIDKTNLDKATSCPWHGIEVWGNRNLPQSNTSANGQGTLIMFGSSISNARDAITTIKDTPSGWDWNFTGGIVQTLFGTLSGPCVFIDCGRCAQFLSYRNFNPNNTAITLPNRSFFKNTFFLTTSAYDYADLGNPFSFVSLYDVSGVKFYDCIFQNISPVGQPNTWGTGIKSIDASYIVGSATSPCIFQNMYYGIDASTSNPMLAIYVTNTTFDQNVRGILLSGSDYSSIMRNTFITNNNYFSYGLYLNSCSHYWIESNSFTSNQVNSSAGIYVNNSGKASNMIYNNTFTNLTYGTLALNQNDGPAAADGLRINCDDYSNNRYDIGVLGYFPTDIGRIQGLCTGINQDATRNTYSNCVSTQSQYNINASVVTHNTYHAALTSTSITDPTCSSPLLTHFFCASAFNKTNDCPSTANNNPSNQRVAIQSWTNQINQLQAQIDGGNTNSLLNSVNSNMSTGQLKNLLISYSPYLSDQILIATINRSHPLSNGNLKDVLIANSPLTPQVLAALNGRSPQLPSGIMNQILNAQVGVSAREDLENNIALKNSNIDLAYDQIIRYFLSDTAGLGIDSAINILSTLNNDEAKCDKAALQIANGDLNGASTTIAGMINDPSHSEFCSYMNLILQIKQALSGGYVIIADTLLSNTIASVANNPLNPYSTNAQTLLDFVFNIDFPELIIFPDDGSNLRIASSDQNEIQNENSVSVFPNPASDNMTVKFTSHDSLSNCIFEMYSLEGRLMKKQIIQSGINTEMNIAEFPAGVYLYIIREGENVIQRDRLVIIH